MGAVVYSEDSTHRANLIAAEKTRQQAQVPGASQSVVAAADVAFYRTAIASALANGCSIEPFVAALKGNHDLNA